MPTYDYQCSACGARVEVFHGMNDAPRRKCPKCGRFKLARRIGSGAAILFKGQGFYQTDYRSESYRKGAEAEKPKSESKGDAGAKSEAKGEAPKPDESAPKKSDSKSEKK